MLLDNRHFSTGSGCYEFCVFVCNGMIKKLNLKLVVFNIEQVSCLSRFLIQYSSYQANLVVSFCARFGWKNSKNKNEWDRSD